ncbi:acyl-CoA thioester hydrolase/BAAT C-terminal domain-containing protein [Cellulomonas fimi]|uniref:Alpha/beta hydrolase fold domain-containing protein n=1 Tax=Cellulomonas fimi TaxID=1708 RepID=A0A7Y0QHM3_CELFI|nr:acyl-CoA thioester hydrolase/BAAT C-terminal domain-containing protein [Cellulomonas fimi]NMR19307.1 alpha/beta hydrolase fold domain-containing protein [Cellulomonas fimi]
MLFRTAATTAVGIIVLAVLGAVLGPQWDPSPLTDPLVVERSSTVIGGPVDRTPVGTYRVETEVVDVQLDGAVVQAQISRPVDAPGDLPGVVFVHGAGTGEFRRAFRVQAHDLASAGIVTLVPNKRLDTYSTRHRDYESMAADYARSVDVLRSRDGVDPDRVGVYGESEGAWIAPVMTARDPTLAFAALVSAPVVPPRQQAAYAADNYLRNTGVPDGVFRAIPRAVGMALPGGGFEYADFVVTPFQKRTTQPVFVAYGTADASLPLVQGARRIIDDLAEGGNDQVTVRYYAGADHGLRVDGRVSADLVRDLARWIDGLPATVDAAPRIAGGQPYQTFLAEPVATPRWFGDGDTVVNTVVGGAAAVVVGAVVLLVARFARREGTGLARGLGGPLLALALGSLLTVVALVWYLVSVARLALDYERNAWVVQGGWVGVRLLGVAAVVGAAMLVNRVGDLRKDEEATAVDGPAATVSLVLVSVGSVVLLVMLAYWGVFQLGI